jgi:hypothetical protein
MREWRYSSTILTSALDGGEKLASSPGRFTPGEEPPVPVDWRLGRPQSRYWHYGEEKNPAPTGNRTPAVQPVAIPSELSRLLCRQRSREKQINSNKNEQFLCSSNLLMFVSGAFPCRTRSALCCSLQEAAVLERAKNSGLILVRKFARPNDSES